jgi:TolB-like protein
MNKRLISIGIALLLLMMLAGTSNAGPKQIAIVPFKVNADKDVSFLRDGIYEMLSSRLYKDGEVEVMGRQQVEMALGSMSSDFNELKARELGKMLGADFVVFGSLTALGNSISVDSKVVNVTGANPTVSLFEQSKDASGIISRINIMVADVNEKVLGRTTTAKVPASAPQAQPGQLRPPDSQQQHPEKMLKQQPGFGGGSGPPFAKSDESAREFSPQFWKSAAYKLAFNGVALGDVDGDGKIETVIITADKVIVYRYEQQRFYQVTEYEIDTRVPTSALMWPTSTATAFLRSSSPA